MAFPDAPRVLYEINPLDEVVCQLKFSPVLRIDTEPPAVFQEAIRERFPLYRAESSVKLSVKFSPTWTASAAPDLGPGLFGAGQKHVFETADKTWLVSLTREVLALTCRRYDRWENFRSRLVPPLEALAAVYRPSFFGHVCLRYRNVIRKWRLEVPPDIPWSELIEPWICGPYGRAEVVADVESVQTRTVIRLPDAAGRLDASYGLAVEQVAEQPGKRSVFLIDAHLYKDGQTETADVIPSLNALNRQAGLFFRWCITDRLHGALRPGNAGLGAR
jgi:uncharacterized protein (TIGR04255 family)